MKEVTMYLLDNGDLYEDQDEARQADLFLELVTLVDRNLLDDDAQSIAIFIANHKEQILHFLNNYKKEGYFSSKQKPLNFTP